MTFRSDSCLVISACLLYITAVLRLWVYVMMRRQQTECLLPALYPPVAVIGWLVLVCRGG